MTASSDHSDNLPAADFNLKHRLTGAGLLISLGVVVLPWLLGSYSISMDDSATAQSHSSEQLVDEGGDKVADNSIAITDDQEIKVFVSKIKPVDSQGRQIYTAQKASAPATSEKKTQPKPTTKDVEQVKATLKKKLDGQSLQSKVSESANKAKAVAKAEAPKKTVSKPKTTQPQKTETPKKIEQGYIVSVGVFLKRDGAERVMKDLKQKGFKPSSSESNSSKGLATRVWLGPFLTRAAAGKERSKLERIVGEKGWIIQYP